jgi:hypothetical protein
MNITDNMNNMGNMLNKDTPTRMKDALTATLKRAELEKEALESALLKKKDELRKEIAAKVRLQLEQEERQKLEKEYLEKVQKAVTEKLDSRLGDELEVHFAELDSDFNKNKTKLNPIFDGVASLSVEIEEAKLAHEEASKLDLAAQDALDTISKSFEEAKEKRVAAAKVLDEVLEKKKLVMEKAAAFVGSEVVTSSSTSSEPSTFSTSSRLAPIDTSKPVSDTVRNPCVTPSTTPSRPSLRIEVGSPLPGFFSGFPTPNGSIGGIATPDGSLLGTSLGVDGVESEDEYKTADSTPAKEVDMSAAVTGGSNNNFEMESIEVPLTPGGDRSRGNSLSATRNIEVFRNREAVSMSPSASFTSPSKKRKADTTPASAVEPPAKKTAVSIKDKLKEKARKLL